MLPKENRLRKEKDFKKVFQKCKSFKEDFLILKTAKNNLDSPRFGIIVSQKVSQKAVVRNKIKRRLAAIIKNKLKMTELRADNLLIALPGLEKKDFNELKETIEKLLKRAKIIQSLW